MKFQVMLYQDDFGRFFAECPTMPGCTGEGNSEEEAMNTIRDSIKRSLHERHEKQYMLTAQTREIDVSLNI